LDALLESLGPDGKDFELLCEWYLENEPIWKSIFRQVWLWDEWPDRWGRDRGIDLIAETLDGHLFAIQAKNYGSAHSITKSDVDKFLSESSRSAISERLLIASTDHVSRSALEVMRAQEKPVSTCLRDGLRRSDVIWPRQVGDLNPATVLAAKPRPHQIDALRDIEAWVDSGEQRGQVVMACGTGKSLIEAWAADHLAAKKVLVLVPTLALLRQTAGVWARHAATKRRFLSVCSDTQRSEVEDLAKDDELGNLRTTDPQMIADALQSDQPLLAICTYNSSPAVAKAMERTDRSFELAIADEAHRCAGFESSPHKTILNGEAIRADRRLFFTATPTVFGTRDKSRARDRSVKLASMDDSSLFGSVVHHLSFAEAIKEGLLCPYQVAVIPVSDNEVHQLIARHRIVTADGDENLDAASLATQIACARAMGRFGCRRIVAFQPTVVHSKRFSAQFLTASNLLESHDAPSDPVWVEHVDGAGMRPARRAQILDRFSADEPPEHRLLSNVKLLAEGVDVPGIDAVAFIDTHRGQSSIIQAVGRAVRLAPGKTIGTIVLPVVLRAGEPLDAALARSEHRPVIDILGALRSHDPDIARSLDDLRFSYRPDDRPTMGSGRFMIDAPVQVGPQFAKAVGLALTRALGVSPSSHSTRRRPESESQVLEPDREPTEDELFEIGVGELRSLGRFDLLPRVPEAAREFPMAQWWDEAKRRWRAGTIDQDDKWTIAMSISWLAEDLADEPRIRDEMAAMSDARLAEQVVAQLRAGGIFTEGTLAPLAESELLLEEMLDPVSHILDAVTHAAMLPDQQLAALLPAMESLAKVVVEVSRDLESGDWDWGPVRLAALDGFAETLRQADKGAGPVESVPWRRDTEPEAFAAGARAAMELLPRVFELEPLKFRGDRAVVEWGQEQQRDLPPDEQLDELGWEIFLLTSARGGAWSAFEQAMDGTLRQRQRVRRDLLARGSINREGETAA
jgi:superfamily II DNA or RNA helicase